MTGSFSNVGAGSIQNRTTAPSNKQGPQFEGTLIGNINENLKSIGAGITTLIGGVIGYDQEGRQALGQILGAVQGDSEKQRNLADALLSTYNLALDDIGNMPLGEMVGNVLTGIWKHPIDAYLDFATIYHALTPNKVPKNITDKLTKVDEAQTRIKFAEDLTKDNLKLHQSGNNFIKEIENIERKYSPKEISLGMQALETVGFKNAPDNLKAIMADLNKANATYKQFTSMAGAEILDDVEFAARELLSKEHNISFESTAKLKNTQMYKEAVDYVRENDVRPLFHLKPKVHDLGDLTSDVKVESELLKRKFGTIDYADAPNNLSKKASEFVNKVVGSEVIDSPVKLNEKIREFNKETGSKVKEVQAGSLFNNRVWKELNAELKKNMLSGGVYLGANVLTTTLSILNNFDVNAVLKTAKNMSKFRMVELAEAKTPILHTISKLNNKFYRPIASIDRYLENIATEYISNYGIDKAKFLQSTIPSKTVVSNPALAAVKELVPFGSYPAAAVQEVGAHIQGRPIKSNIYNQINKIGQEANIQAQQILGIQPDRTQALRKDEDGNVVTRNTVVTPIQAANMFLFGEYGDAIQIPLIQFLNKLVSGQGNPDIFEVNGKKYKVVNGSIQTTNGEMSLIPSLSYIGRSLLSPVQFYNQVITPLLSDKYVRDESKLFNRLVDDSQYANMSSQAKQKVTDKAREKLGKRLLGTYEYKKFDNSRVSKTVRRKVMQKRNIQRSIDRALK